MTTFRKQQRRLTQHEQELMDQLHTVAQDLQDIIDILPHSRQRDVAMTRLEEAVMWAEKSIIEGQ